MKASSIPDSSRGSQHLERTFTYSASILMQQPVADREFLIMLQGILLISAEELQHKHWRSPYSYMHNTRKPVTSATVTSIKRLSLNCFIICKSPTKGGFMSWVFNIWRLHHREQRQITTVHAGWRFPSANMWEGPQLVAQIIWLADRWRQIPTLLLTQTLICVL